MLAITLLTKCNKPNKNKSIRYTTEIADPAFLSAFTGDCAAYNISNRNLCCSDKIPLNSMKFNLQILRVL